MFDTRDAHIILSETLRFAGVQKQTDYIAVFQNSKGRELALERDRTEAFYVWLEKYNTVIPGVAIKNQEKPGEPYGRKQPRNSNLNDKNCPNLKVGNRVWYLEIESPQALRELAKWYAAL
ncbi:hypothetical protein DU002_12000 [Corallincola holothuriorum]|uniref:Uncharacterized protein n=1 Tax=Corallincola holothuriorum TaxID=2282215 RepID=A0A368NEK4_9GAMM|nr:hypothetical protein [Corallincola holothuriorum]RCU49077.1 hypothetical protein DU002_12000 [Corallincola holothuriorum]